MTLNILSDCFRVLWSLFSCLVSLNAQHESYFSPPMSLHAVNIVIFWQSSHHYNVLLCFWYWKLHVWKPLCPSAFQRLCLFVLQSTRMVSCHRGWTKSAFKGTFRSMALRCTSSVKQVEFVVFIHNTTPKFHVVDVFWFHIEIIIIIHQSS